MVDVTAAGVQRMRDQLFIEGPDAGRRMSRFWILLVLAAIIASAGVIADSTATVIGAMIVAPLMGPIVGIALAVVLVDRRNLVRSVLLVLGGAIAVIVIGYLAGLLSILPVVAANNAQVAARVAPRLLDLVAALATGVVGAIALIRSDISDTLPGVAVAISLVPPLAVVGLTAESGAWSEAGGALLLFVANVSAIMAAAIVVMAIYGVFRIPGSAAAGAPRARPFRRSSAVVVIVMLVVLVVLPLALSTVTATTSAVAEQDVRNVVEPWAARTGWKVDTVQDGPDGVLVRLIGPLPAPDPEAARDQLDAAGLRSTRVVLVLVPEQRLEIPVRPGS